MTVNGLTFFAVLFLASAAKAATGPRALPGPGEPLRFAVFGDLGTASPAQKAVAALLDKADPQFVLLLGDIVYPGGDRADYETKYFPIYGRTLSRIPFFPAVGNHDYGNFKKSKPKGEARFAEGYGEVFRRPPYYSFKAGDAEFFSVDTNREGYDIPAAASIAAESEQWLWLRRALESSLAKWKFVFLHVPLYSSSWHGDHAALRSFLKPLFDGKVDVVFQGHDHVYERRRPIDGVLYVTAGTGGAKLKRVLLPDDTVAERDREHGLVVATLDGGKLRLEFRDIEGEVEDAVELEKP